LTGCGFLSMIGKMENKKMAKSLKLIIFLVILFGFTGCKSIRVGGSGQVGSVHGGGGADIPIPNKTK